MGRPLNLRPKRTATGWQASLPGPRGTRGRKTHTFTAGGPDHALRNAEAWLRDGAAHRDAGRPLPDPALYDRSPTPGTPGMPGPRAGRRSLASAIQLTLHRRYEVDRRAEPGRVADIAARVANIVLPWFDARSAADTLALDELTAEMLIAFAQHLAGRDVAVPDGDDHGWWISEAPLEVAVAALLCASPAGQVVAAASDRGVELTGEGATVSPAQLLDWGLLDPRTHPEAFGYARDYSSDVLRVVRWAVTDAMAAGWIDRDVTAGVKAVEPDDVVRRRPPDRVGKRPLRLAEAQAVFSHLHLVHLGVAWIQRLCGPRVSEVYGPRVADLDDRGSYGLLTVAEQGGGQFRQRDERGRIVAVPRKDTLKTSWSKRVVVVPGSLMVLLRQLIAAFHTDDSGVVDRDARLIPGIVAQDTAGVAGYRQALDQAFATEGLTYETLGFHPSTHWLRASLATDLKKCGHLPEQEVRRMLGHQPGDDVSDLVYFLDDPEHLAPFEQIAAALDAMVADQLGDLRTPSRLPDFGHGNPIRGRLSAARELLTARGWLPADAEEPDAVCGTLRVADELGIAETTARRWMREGRLATEVETVEGVERRVARLEDVERLRDQLDAHMNVAELARTLGIDYHAMYRLVGRLDLDIPQGELDGRYRLTPAQCDIVRQEHDRIAALHRRAMRVGQAAEELGIGDRRVRHLIKEGVLEVDDETDLSGYRFVTRRSIADYQRRQRPAPVPRGRSCLTVTEAAALAGLSREHIVALIREGLLAATLDGRRQVIEVEAMRAWAAGYRPDLLPRLAG